MSTRTPASAPVAAIPSRTAVTATSLGVSAAANAALSVCSRAVRLAARSASACAAFAAATRRAFSTASDARRPISSATARSSAARVRRPDPNAAIPNGPVRVCSGTAIADRNPIAHPSRACSASCAIAASDAWSISANSCARPVASA
jgi:hypothetical protein